MEACGGRILLAWLLLRLRSPRLLLQLPLLPNPPPTLIPTIPRAKAATQVPSQVVSLARHSSSLSLRLFSYSSSDEANDVRKLKLDYVPRVDPVVHGLLVLVLPSRLPRRNPLLPHPGNPLNLQRHRVCPLRPRWRISLDVTTGSSRWLGPLRERA